MKIFITFVSTLIIVTSAYAQTTVTTHVDAPGSDNDGVWQITYNTGTFDSFQSDIEARPWWGNEGRKTLRNILNSAHGISDKDYSSSALRNRSLTSLEALEGIEFLAEIDQKKGSDGIKRNELKNILQYKIN